MAASAHAPRPANQGWLDRFFGISAAGSSVRTEIVAGITVFMTMAYIVVVNPAILEAAGIPFGPSMTATILVAIFGTLIMGLYANRPFAIAPYMGTNAYIAFVVVKGMGYSWQTALGAVLVGGVLFTVLTVTRLRGAVVAAIPMPLKHGFSVGIGLFLTYVGLASTGLVVKGEPLVSIGNLKSPPVLLAAVGLLLVAALMVRRVPGALLVGMVLTALVGIPLGVTQMPQQWVSVPPSISAIAFKMDIAGVFSAGALAAMFTIFLQDFLSTMGTLIGVANQAGMLDQDGNLPQIEKPMLADALSCVVAGLLGTTSAGAFVESAAGVEAGGRTGLTAVVCAIGFALTLFFSPIAAVIPAAATGPVLILIGMLTLAPLKELDFSDYTDLFPAFITIVLMALTYNPAAGIAAGFIAYTVIKLVSGRAAQVRPAMYVLTLLSLFFFAL